MRRYPRPARNASGNAWTDGHIRSGGGLATRAIRDRRRGTQSGKLLECLIDQASIVRDYHGVTRLASNGATLSAGNVRRPETRLEALGLPDGVCTRAVPRNGALVCPPGNSFQYWSPPAPLPDTPRRVYTLFDEILMRTLRLCDGVLIRFNVTPRL